MTAQSIQSCVLLTTILFFCTLSTGTGCGRKKESLPCEQNIPENVAGLQVRGPRTPRNIIHAMQPIVCFFQEQFHQRQQLSPDLKPGVVTVRVLVENNGEVYSCNIVKSTIGDTLFVRNLVDAVMESSFPIWHAKQEETEFEYPIRFKGKSAK